MKLKLLFASIVVASIFGSSCTYNIDIDACKIWSFNEHGERICIERY